MINQVRASLSSLSKSERAVAETILADPEHSVHLSIARLARLRQESLSQQ